MFVHIVAGLLCLVTGPVALAAKPKGGQRHRNAGRVFLWGVLVLAVTAALLLGFRWNPFFFALSVFSFSLAFSGWRVLGRKRPHADPAQRARPADWAAALVTAAIGVVAVRWYRDGGFGDQADQAAVVLGMLSFAAAAAVYDLWRFAAPGGLARRWPRLAGGVWLLEHLTKLGGAFIAVACAFSGTVLSDLPGVPPALAQIAPAVLGTPPLILVANRYWRRMRD
jgi:hypothetical protein